MGVPSPVWGPLRGTETKRVGAHAAVVSMVVTPTIPSALVQHLNDEVLLKVRPHPVSYTHLTLPTNREV